jgi:tetratricopeptide (TPR) repeat protein
MERDLAAAQTHKERGNAHYLAGENADAIAAYESGIVALAPHITTKASPADDGNGNAPHQGTLETAVASADPAKQLRGECFAAMRALMLNLAACRLRVLDYERCVATCDAVIGRDPQCAKAFYRRARGREGLGDTEGALEDMERAEALGADAAAGAVAQLRERLAEEERADERAERAARGAEPEDVPDDLPPLDDMEDYLVARGVDISGAAAAGGSAAAGKEQRKKKQRPVFKKGFLTSDAARKTSAAPSAAAAGSGAAAASTASGAAAGASTAAYTVTGGGGAGGSGGSGFVFDEVQDAMRASSGLAGRKDEWLTPDLLTLFASNPILMRGMAKPEYKEAIDMMSSDPAGAMKRYGNDPELTAFLRAFAGAMGDHFSKIADMQESSNGKGNGKGKGNGGTGTGTGKGKGKGTGTSSTAVVPSASRGPPISDKEAQKADEMVQRPEIREALMDPEVQAVLQLLRAGRQGPELQARLANPETGRKIHLLVQNGLLKVER